MILSLTHPPGARSFFQQCGPSLGKPPKLSLPSSSCDGDGDVQQERERDAAPGEARARAGWSPQTPKPSLTWFDFITKSAPTPF